MSDAESTSRLPRRWRRSPTVRVVVFAAVACLGFWGAMCLDWPVHRGLPPLEEQVEIVEPDVWRLLRSMGYLPAWVALTIAMFLVDRRRGRPVELRAVATRRSRRGWMVLITVAAAGVANAVLKLLVRRQRPPTWTAWDGVYLWRSWADKPFSTSGLGLPSGHASVAFAGMFLLCRMYPAAAPVFVLLAIGCAATRVASRGHFVSDVWVSAVLGWLIAWLIWRLLPKWRPCANQPT